jgi:hypothetical protein
MSLMKDVVYAELLAEGTRTSLTETVSLRVSAHLISRMLRNHNGIGIEASTVGGLLISCKKILYIPE